MSAMEYPSLDAVSQLIFYHIANDVTKHCFDQYINLNTYSESLSGFFGGQ